ncbi:MAG: biphenyl 2,3-dioxygenase [candidate division Zixibacteria bacterium HGW-Zixibacteria-1]|nr:MAG: biphenyl 2,3-dioxygenase [candidate division Zixibacteria bacterium HGW-Zixibacteria-1]
MTGQFVKVCRVEDILAGATRVVEIEGRTILLAKLNGEVFALQNMCTHDGGLLGDADIIDGQIECPRHGARFDIKTGEATQMPAVAELDTYEVKIEDGDVYVAVDK